MSSFGDKVIQKLGKCIPDSEVQKFKTLSVICLREGGPAGLQKLKDEFSTLQDDPGEELVKEIEDIFNDFTINALSLVFQNKQAAAIAGVLTIMADKVYLDEQISSEQKTKVMEDTRKLLNKLEACSKTRIEEETMAEVLEHTEQVTKINIVVEEMTVENVPEEAKKEFTHLAERITNILKNTKLTSDVAKDISKLTNNAIYVSESVSTARFRNAVKELQKTANELFDTRSSNYNTRSNDTRFSSK